MQLFPYSQGHPHRLSPARSEVPPGRDEKLSCCRYTLPRSLLLPVQTFWTWRFSQRPARNPYPGSCPRWPPESPLLCPGNSPSRRHCGHWPGAAECPPVCCIPPEPEASAAPLRRRRPIWLHCIFSSHYPPNYVSMTGMLTCEALIQHLYSRLVIAVFHTNDD